MIARDTLKKIYYNIKPLPVIGSCAAFCVRFARYIKRSANNRRLEVPIRTASYAEELTARISDIYAVLDGLNKSVIAQEKALSSQNQSIYGCYAVLDGLNKSVVNLGSSIYNENAAYRDRLEFVRDELMFEIRKALGLVGRKTLGQFDDHIIIEPKVINKSKLITKPLRFNLGCGHISIPDFVNVDARDLPGVDLVADVTKIPIDPGQIQEIYAAHLVEHFPRHFFRDIILPHWIDLLESDGLLRIVIPNSEAMIKAFQEGQMTFTDLALVTFGKQEYDGDFHYAMYNPDSITELLRDAGLCHVQVLCANRKNGLCRELEIIARKAS